MVYATVGLFIWEGCKRSISKEFGLSKMIEDIKMRFKRKYKNI